MLGIRQDKILKFSEIFRKFQNGFIQPLPPSTLTIYLANSLEKTTPRLRTAASGDRTALLRHVWREAGGGQSDC